MPSLAELQEALVAHAYGDEHPLVPWLCAVPGNAAGLAVCTASCRGALHEALADVYPVVRAIVGGPCFDALARRYLRAHPSRHADLHAFGGGLADFVAAAPELSALEYLADVARLEWAWHESYHAPDEPPLDLAALAAVAPEHHAGLRFRLARHVRLIACRYPALAIWEAHQTGAIAEAPLAVAPGWTVYLSYRSEGVPVVAAPPAEDRALLAALAEGRPLGPALVGSGAPADALARWVAAGVLLGRADGA